MAVGLGESPLFERLREDGLLLQHQQNDESTAIVTIARTNAELQTPLFSIRLPWPIGCTAVALATIAQIGAPQKLSGRRSKMKRGGWYDR
jgi:hypothetical protein